MTAGARMTGVPVRGYRNFPAENAVAMVASRLIAVSLRESRNVDDD